MINYNDFKNSWLQDLDANTNQFAIQFSTKLLSQAIDLEEHNEQIVECNGSDNFGLDIVYFQEDETDKEDKLFLMVSKYSTNYQNLLDVKNHIPDVLNIITKDLSTSKLPDKAKQIIKTALNNNSQINIFIGNIEELEHEETIAIHNLRERVKSEISNLIHLRTITIKDIYDRFLEYEEKSNITLELSADIKPSGDYIYMGSMQLLGLYSFLLDYENITNDLKMIYEKNVRNYQGGGKQVNRGIRKTILLYPQFFGMFNNGITIVADEITNSNPEKYQLKNPYIVNGCQTTKTIYDTLSTFEKYEQSWLKEVKTLQRGKDSDDFDPPVNYQEWTSRLKEARILVKIVQTGIHGDKLLKNTTKYTNSQIPVTSKDFYSITDSFKNLQFQMKSEYNVFLEIQGGSWVAIKTAGNQYEGWIKAIEVIKVFSAGWLNKPGEAFGKNPPFTPGGTIFKQITENNLLSVKDAYCAYKLKEISMTKYKFSSKDPEYVNARGQTRYLFYYVVIQFLRDILATKFIKNKPPEEINTKLISSALLQLFNNGNIHLLLDNAAFLIDDYMKPNYDVNDDCVYTEPVYGNDFNAFLKVDHFKKSIKLNNKIGVFKWNMKKIHKGIVEYDEIVKGLKISENE